MSPKSLYNPIRTSDMMRRRRADGAAAHTLLVMVRLKRMAALSMQLALSRWQLARSRWMAAAGAEQMAAGQIAVAGADGDAAQALGARGEAAEKGLYQLPKRWP